MSFVHLKDSFNVYFLILTHFATFIYVLVFKDYIFNFYQGMLFDWRLNISSTYLQMHSNYFFHYWLFYLYFCKGCTLSCKSFYTNGVRGIIKWKCFFIAMDNLNKSYHFIYPYMFFGWMKHISKKKITSPELLIFVSC